jgi:hypothetical protein
MENKDNFIYEVSTEDQSPLNTIEQQQWIFANDASNNNYGSNQIVFDLTSFYNASTLISWREAYLQIPLVSVVETEYSGTPLARYNAYALKNGYANLINSIQVECSNSTVNQVSNNISFYTNFKVYTEKSKDWFNTSGPSFGYYDVDDSNSWSFNTTLNNFRGVGSTNNLMAPPGASATLTGQTLGNQSLFDRGRSALVFNNATADPVGSGNGAANIISPSSYAQSGNDYYTSVAKDGAPNTFINTYYHTAIIRLGDMADFFDKLNLCRAYVRLIVNVNTGSVEIPYAAGNGVISGPIISNFSFNTCPFILPALDGSTAFSNPKANITKIKATIGVVKVIIGSTTYNHNLTATRVYAPSILLNPEKEKLYRMNNAQKLIVWRDVFSTSISNTAAGNSVNYVISNGITNLVGILTIPMINGVSNIGATNITNGFAPLAPNLLPFGSEPSTTSPILNLFNFNAFVGGKSVMPSNIIYSWEAFINQFNGVNALNGGGQVSGNMCSGIIDYNKWSNNYRYYYLDCSRRNEADTTPKSITIQFQNNNAVAIDCYFFVLFERKAMLDIVSGQLQML